MTENPRYSWNQPICFDCFNLRQPNRVPVRLKSEAFDTFEETIQVCLDCGRFTIEGIFIRIDPQTVKYPTHLEED